MVADHNPSISRKQLFPHTQKLFKHPTISKKHNVWSRIKSSNKRWMPRALLWITQWRKKHNSHWPNHPTNIHNMEWKLAHQSITPTTWTMVNVPLTLGSSLPTSLELPNKYYPYSSEFTKGFNGGNFKFNGLNTVKTVSGIHQALNDFWFEYNNLIKSYLHHPFQLQDHESLIYFPSSYDL